MKQFTLEQLQAQIQEDPLDNGLTNVELAAVQKLAEAYRDQDEFFRF